VDISTASKRTITKTTPIIFETTVLIVEEEKLIDTLSNSTQKLLFLKLSKGKASPRSQRRRD
jgi:hypothetical protein